MNNREEQFEAGLRFRHRSSYSWKAGGMIAGGTGLSAVLGSFGILDGAHVIPHVVQVLSGFPDAAVAGAGVAGMVAGLLKMSDWTAKRGEERKEFDETCRDVCSELSTLCRETRVQYDAIPTQPDWARQQSVETFRRWTKALAVLRELVVNTEKELRQPAQLLSDVQSAYDDKLKESMTRKRILGVFGRSGDAERESKIDKGFASALLALTTVVRKSCGHAAAFATSDSGLGILGSVSGAVAAKRLD